MHVIIYCRLSRSTYSSSNFGRSQQDFSNAVKQLRLRRGCDQICPNESLTWKFNRQFPDTLYTDRESADEEEKERRGTDPTEGLTRNVRERSSETGIVTGQKGEDLCDPYEGEMKGGNEIEREKERAR